MITEEERRDLDTIIRISQDQQRLENRILNAMAKADHEKIMKELEREEEKSDKKVDSMV